MKHLKILTLCFICIALANCSDKRAEHQKIKNDLAAKYNAISDNEELNGYVYELQSRIVANNKALCLIGKIKDIANKDSSFLLHIKLNKSNGSKYYLAQLNVNKDLAAKLNSAIQEDGAKSGAFAFHVTSILSGGGTETRDDPDGDNYNYDVTSVIFKGDLIDFKLFGQK